VTAAVIGTRDLVAGIAFEAREAGARTGCAVTDAHVGALSGGVCHLGGSRDIGPCQTRRTRHRGTVGGLVEGNIFSGTVAFEAVTSAGCAVANSMTITVGEVGTICSHLRS
jgi:hypothetical protein